MYLFSPIGVLGGEKYYDFIAPTVRNLSALMSRPHASIQAVLGVVMASFEAPAKPPRDVLKYVVTAPADAIELRNWFARRRQAGMSRFTAGELLLVLRSLFAGLVHIHSLQPPTIHGAIIGENIFIQEEASGRVSAAMLGCITAPNLASDPLSRGHFISYMHIQATPFMIPPECNDGAYDQLSDVFRLGSVVLDVMISLTIDGIPARLNHIKEKLDLRDFVARNNLMRLMSLAPDLVPLISCMCAKQREQRLDSRAVLQRLEAISLSPSAASGDTPLTAFVINAHLL